MVVAHGYGPSDGLERLRLLRGRFEGKGAVGGMSPFPVAALETDPHPRWPQSPEARDLTFLIVH